MLYGLDDLVTEIAYACSLRKSEAKRFYHALVQQLEHLMRQGKGARCPGLGRWSFLGNSRRQKGYSLCGNQPVRQVHLTILHEVISR